MADWADNPFAASDDANPFADPSVTAAASQVPEYNPFDAPAPSQGSKAPAPAAPAPAAAPAAAAAPAPAKEEPSWAQPEPAAKAQPKPSAEDARRREEYEQREKAANQKKKQQSGGDQQYPPGYRPANWPPFPVACPSPFKPCFHHNIKGEIPAWGRTTLRMLYYHWQFTCLCLFWNFIAALAALDYGGSGTGATAGVSSAFLVCFIPCSYICWFHTIYNAFRKDSSMRFGWFFLTFGFQFIVSCFLAIGFPSTGGAGIWLAAAAVKNHEVVGIMIFTSAVLWIIHALLTLYLLQRVLRIYRSTGQSMQKAENEFKAERDKGIYNAVTSDVGQSAIRGAAAGAANQATASWASEA